MSPPAPTDPFSPGAVLSRWAAMQPDRPALTVLDTDGSRAQLTYADLERRANGVAALLADRGVSFGGMVVIALPTCVEHVVATQALWKLGACPVPLDHRLPPVARDAMLALVSADAVIAEWDGPRDLRREDLIGPESDTPPATQPAPAPFKAIASGGSTGTPKLIVSPAPFTHPDGAHPLGDLLGLTGEHTCYSPGPLYHNQAFLLSSIVLYHGGHAVLNERFDAAVVLAAIADLGVTYLNVVPTMMSRMLKVHAERPADLSSVETLLHLAAPCPPWLKREWIEILGAEKVLELWAATELVGLTVIRGDEWLAHPGSVGRPVDTDLRILDEDHHDVPTGTVGEVFTRRPNATGPPYSYLGADRLETTPDGFASVGDLGHVDDDGYLYLADRRNDLIITGGSNVYPAEVEAALSSHPAVADVVVVGLPDADRGQRVHAIVQHEHHREPPSEADLHRHVAEQLARYKIPRSFEVVESLPRAENGKLRRQALADERQT